MPRRRYRLFMICAVVMLFLLYRVSQNTWEDASHLARLRHPPSSNSPAAGAETQPKPAPKSEPESDAASKPKPEAKPESKSESEPERVASQQKQSKLDEDDEPGVKVPKLKEIDDSRRPVNGKASAHGGSESNPTSENAGSSEEDEEKEYIHQKKPPKVTPGDPVDGRIHWTPVSEHFPVPAESIVSLPTGRPQKVPRVQHEFGVESPEAKARRVSRQARVGKEIERAWSGYKKYAWMHDELSPVSASNRDPFCGWAATLVDSLDTLWIAGLKKQFDEAAKAVEKIDFTTTPRHNIPVFETTIRYLGGLLGAFDVSGGHEGGYPVLLRKAVELAEILMGIFDTPNRMPILYYQWQPQYASQPHRAGSAGIAELGTLSMEFTRLAQLTGEDKYYDAVDRITDALVALQAAGTSIPGLFPENLDASGCNHTATALRSSLSEAAQKQMDEDVSKKPTGYVPGKATRAEPQADGQRPGKQRVAEENEFIVGNLHADDALGKLQAADEARARSKGFVPSEFIVGKIGHQDLGFAKQGPREDDKTETRPSDTAPENNEAAEKPGEAPAQKMVKRGVPPFGADGFTSNWDCVPQGLKATEYGFQQYHMGGGQDSAYEYFPKEYLLLGGLESKYRKLYEDSVKAINEWLLYRPMTDGEWDILFPARVTTSGNPSQDLVATFEVTHLTCFIGGMYGLGGKIFGRPKDLETAKKLTDGCVWAYQSTLSGIMPEGSQVLPCPSLEKCAFNQTLWWEKLDPAKEWRDRQLAKWEEDKAALEKKQGEKAPQGKGDPRKTSDKDKETAGEVLEKSAKEYAAAESADGSGAIRKRAALPPPKDGKASASGADDVGSELPQSLKDRIGSEGDEQKRPAGVGVQRDPNGPIDSVLEAHRLPPRESEEQQIILRDRPQTHEEFVKKKIKDQGLTPGVVHITSAQYILRPEAIESVWYMYRITGDPTWMEKGWKMFEATISATRTEIANSAVRDVNSGEPALKDEMESFWLAETLKYYYLLFSEPSVISLDEWVLNTEAHPFKRPGGSVIGHSI
ncbi:mannosyl-oligosaccharide alpha-1 [Trichoderma cornu-damae]|uniref:alpha-1,2-Mannosidase n=1 Tax=Trichoderma cornu-damae TaxID=654480 RepID=A0A9P8TV29_9HYPO|nr:mannosyl-oligosaccharide alpha-1 [Trichoderma cornu-damae]